MSDPTDMQGKVESLIKAAAVAERSEDAMKFSQAALNAANALCSLGHALEAEVKRNSQTK